MSNPHFIVLSDSDEEMESPPLSPIPSSPSDSNAEPEEYVPKNEPETESKINIPPPSPFHATYDTSGPYTVNRPRKRVAIHHRQGKSPVIPVLPNDPYIRPTSPQTDTTYHWVKDTLDEWRKLDIFPPMPNMGESSNAHQMYPFTHEPPQHTIPILIAHSVRQDDRLNHIEDAMLAMPGPEAMLDAAIHTTQLGQHLDAVRADIVDLKNKTKDNSLDAYILGKRLDGIDFRITEMDAMLHYLVAMVSKK